MVSPDDTELEKVMGLREAIVKRVLSISGCIVTNAIGMCLQQALNLSEGALGHSM